MRIASLPCVMALALGTLPVIAQPCGRPLGSAHVPLLLTPPSFAAPARDELALQKRCLAWEFGLNIRAEFAAGFLAPPVSHSFLGTVPSAPDSLLGTPALSTLLPRAPTDSFSPRFTLLGVDGIARRVAMSEPGLRSAP